MAIAVFGSAAVLLVLSYSVMNHRIHLFEGILIWVFIILVQNHFLWLMGLNNKLLEPTGDWLLFLVYDVVRSILVPLGMILFLEVHERLNRIGMRLLNGVLFLSVFAGMEYAAIALDILILSDEWKLWYTAANWSLNMVLTLLYFQWIRSIARKEVRL